MIIVNETGSQIMQFSSDFDKYARDVLHISNPFHRYYRNMAKYCSTMCDGTLTIDIEASQKHDRETRVEREEWVRLREQYVAERILRELGYEALTSTHYKEYLQDAIPCEGATGQCCMDCPKYLKCGL